MILLGLESSCDETAAALVNDNTKCQRGRSQSSCRLCPVGRWCLNWQPSHVQHVPGVIERVLNDAQLQAEQIDAIAVSSWPGLMGSLLCGVNSAKMLSLRWGKPLIAVDHIQAHLQGASLESEPLCYPAIGLVVSGGHSHIYRMASPTQLELIGGTIDDAAGEAFDKAAAILDLGYPGGPIIDQLAESGDPTAFKLPRSLLHSGDLRLSFAGLKTALLYQVRGPQGKPLTLSQQGIADAAASFQAAVCDVLVKKTIKACLSHRIKQVVIGGGVACNRGLRVQLSAACDEADIALRCPSHGIAADNASMVASLGQVLYQEGTFATSDPATSHWRCWARKIAAIG